MLVVGGTAVSTPLPFSQIVISEVVGGRRSVTTNEMVLTLSSGRSSVAPLGELMVTVKVYSPGARVVTGSGTGCWANGAALPVHAIESVTPFE